MAKMTEIDIIRKLLTGGDPIKEIAIDAILAAQTAHRQMGNTNPQPTTNFPLVMNLAELEREAINQTLSMVDGNREQAAKILGIGERTLYRKIVEYNIKSTFPHTTSS